MKPLPCLVLGLLLLLPAATAATEPGRAPPRSAWQTPLSPDKTKPAPQDCATFGAGFVRLPGSDTCVRVGGAVSIGTATTRGTH